jgi:chemotaxis protein methyltransferase CheR
MVAAMTTNVTRFFREPHHFDHLQKSVLSRLAEEARGGMRVRLWSAGCSSGEEPYSIAIALLDVMPDAPDHDIRILATDIDPDVLNRAQAAVYRAGQVENIPAESRSKCLLPTKDAGEMAFCISDVARELVRFRELNLLDPWPMTGRFDVIFCRNVMIYFDEPTQNDIWLRFAEVLQPGGYLYIGHSERIAADRLPFDLVGQTTYRLRSRAKR